MSFLAITFSYIEHTTDKDQNICKTLQQANQQ